MILHTSNRPEVLIRQLAAALRTAAAPPLQPEIVIVQSQGMARWLQLQLAELLGLCANVQFPFPRAFVRQIFHTFDPSIPEIDPFHPSLATWQVWELLPWLARQPGGEPVDSYLDGDVEGRKRFQLAGRIARLFDDYTVFRPELVLAWDPGGDTHWQALLWRKLAELRGHDHAAVLRTRFLEYLDRAQERPRGLPGTVYLFGMSALPPFQVEVFDRLGKWSAVHLFLLQPSAEYWGDAVSAKAALRRSDRVPPTPSELGRHEGNSLVASLGGQGRDFLNVLLALTEFNTRESFVDPGEDTLLHAIQSDIMNLRNRDASAASSAVQGVDDSVQVHSCHSPLRELEVLHDHILHWFSSGPDLQPRDILVVTPDIETYAPLIDAVFAGAAQRGAGPSIPFSVADRSAGSASPVLNAFARILKLAGGRLGIATVLDLLETPDIRKRFELGEAEVFQAREWLRAAGVRWGENGEHRQRLGLPALRQNTWEDGLDRLLLGYAMTGSSGQLFAGILPCDGAEGNVSESFGRLLHFAHRVFETVHTLEAMHSLPDWIALLRQVVAEFFAETEESEPELLLLRDILNQLNEDQQSSGVTEPLPLAVILEHLTPILEEDHFQSGFLTGRVTFGALKPMRSIPFKIICLLGMNDSAYPRADLRLGFDLMSAQPRLGDKSKREDDRYLFLETILSARQRLYLSYVGQSIRDNSQAPPSVLVSELLDYIGQGFRIPTPADPPAGPPAPAPVAASAPAPKGRGRGSQRAPVPENQLSLPWLDVEPLAASPDNANAAISVRERLTVRHRLQAFNADYFTANRELFSYSEENFRGCQALRKIEPPAPFVGAPLPAPDASWRTVDLNALAEFFANPARYFLTRRMDIRLPRPISELDEREPMELDGIDRFRLKSELLEKRLAGANLDTLRPAFLAGGRLPLGKAGDLLFLELCESVEEFHARLTRFRPMERLPAPELDLELGEFRLVGRFEHVTSVALLHYRPAVVAPRDRMRTWIQHLAWCASMPGQRLVSVVMGDPPKRRTSAGLQYRTLDARPAREFLGKLLEHYWRGLSEPLRFFPNTSLKFAEIDLNNADRRPDAWKNSLRQSRKEWDSDRFNRGEDDDEHYRICFHHFDPLDGDFMALARGIGQPLLQHEAPA